MRVDAEAMAALRALDACWYRNQTEQRSALLDLLDTFELISAEADGAPSSEPTVTRGRVHWDDHGAVGFLDSPAGEIPFSGPSPAAVLNDIDAAFPHLRFAWEPSREGPMVQAMVATITEREKATT